MKKRSKNILVTVVIFVLAILLVCIGIYYKRPASVKGATADLNLSVSELVSDFTTDEAAANAKYLGKIIQARGAIIRIDNHADTLGYIILGDKNSDTYLRCELAKPELGKLKALSADDVLLIKGYCIGYLMDVEMNRAVIEKIIKP